MSLVPLTVDQITESWDSLRERLPAGYNARAILQGLLLMQGTLWVERGDNGPEAFVLTQVDEDRWSGERTLYIALMVSVSNRLTERLLTSGLSELVRYAQGKGCTGLTFHTENRALVEFSKRLKGHVESFVTIPIGGGYGTI